MIIKCDKDVDLEFEVLPPLYLPFYNKWGRNEYYITEAYVYDYMKRVEKMGLPKGKLTVGRGGMPRTRYFRVKIL